MNATELLSDLRDVFSRTNVDRLSTAMILAALIALPDRPWREFRRGRPLNSRQLARLLAPFGIHSRTIRTENGSTAKGYYLEELTDAFNHYLSYSDPSQASSEKCETHPKPLLPNEVTDVTDENLQSGEEELLDSHPTGALRQSESPDSAGDVDLMDIVGELTMLLADDTKSRPRIK